MFHTSAFSSTITNAGTLQQLTEIPDSILPASGAGLLSSRLAFLMALAAAVTSRLRQRRPIADQHRHSVRIAAARRRLLAQDGSARDVRRVGRFRRAEQRRELRNRVTICMVV